jgi:hypothetical protein
VCQVQLTPPSWPTCHTATPPLSLPCALPTCRSLARSLLTVGISRTTVLVPPAYVRVRALTSLVAIVSFFCVRSFCCIECARGKLPMAQADHRPCLLHPFSSPRMVPTRKPTVLHAGTTLVIRGSSDMNFSSSSSDQTVRVSHYHTPSPCPCQRPRPPPTAHSVLHLCDT